jgi:PAS domain S-box-containing protein
MEHQIINQPIMDSIKTEKHNQTRILLVDDDICFLRVAAQILTSEYNFDVQTADSVNLALKAIDTQPFDAVISDYDMPQIDGLEFLRILRNKKNDLPFLIFTGQGREEVAIKALNLGADRYISKHGHPEAVYAELSDAIVKTIERVQSKKLLKESEEKYRTLVEESLQGILVAQGSPPVSVFVNESFAKTLGYTVEEINSLSPQQLAGLVHPEDQRIFFERYKQRLRGQQRNSTFDFRAIKKDGSVLWLRVSSNRILYNGEPAVQGMFLNIDSDKKASENIQKKEARYRELSNSLPEMVFETDERGTITFYNRPGCEITGYTPEDLEKGVNIIEVIAPEDRQRAALNAQKAIAGQPTGPNEYKLLKKNGEILPVLTKTTPFILENGQIGLRGILVDITDRKIFEKNLAENQRRLQLMNEKLKVVESLTRHDVRNKLCGITGNLYILKKRFLNSPESMQYFQNIDQCSDEIEKIFDFVHTYEQLGVDTLAFVNLQQVLNDAIKLFSNQELPKITCKCDGLMVLADSLLTQLFYNLIGNSIKHGKNVNSITVTFEKSDNEGLALIYKDDGIGIPKENKDQIFKMGFSTGGSTGYGLYLIKKMVEVYGWSIKEKGEPENGVRFVIEIPPKDSSGNNCFKFNYS